MAHSTLISLFTDIADAIRAKSGSSATIVADDFPTAIAAIKPTLAMGLIRNDGTLVQSYTYDKKLVTDESITFPAYSTTAQSIKASAVLSPTVTLDYANYNYYILQRFLTIPTYSSSSVAKGRFEYQMESAMYEVLEIPTSDVTIGTKHPASRNVAAHALGAASRIVYWSSGTAIAVYTTAAYGVVQILVAPTISSGVLTVNSPSVSMRGSSTYFSSTYWGYLTDVRAQYVIEVYRVPKGNLNLNGFGNYQQLKHVIDCYDSATQKLN